MSDDQTGTGQAMTHPLIHEDLDSADVDEPCHWPRIVVHRDFEGYFEGQVRRLLAEKGDCRYDVVHVDATPYLPDAVQYEIRDREIHLTFYSALRRGFGSLDWDHLREIL